MDEEKEVIVEVRGGVVQYVECPQGIKVTVKDFDAREDSPEIDIWTAEDNKDKLWEENSLDCLDGKIIDVVWQ